MTQLTAMEKYEVSAERHAPQPLGRAGSVPLRHLRGREEILACGRLLRDFAAKTGQHTAMHGLQFTLEHEYFRRKTPHLFCVLTAPDEGQPLAVDDLVGCGLFFEHRIAGWNTGLFATGDSTGVRTVLALPEHRAEVAALAGCAALRQGRLVLACYRNKAEALPDFAPPGCSDGLWARRVREVRDELKLCAGYERTLQTLGKRTRTHLRYYRKRLLQETRCSFVAEAAAHIDPAQLAELNAASLEPVTQQNFNLQYAATAQGPGGFVCGLRSDAGRWLCLAGGWRQGLVSVLQWQVNLAGFEKLSLTTAFRAFLIEHEIALGTRKLCFHGGTSHSISHAFEQNCAVDLILRRRGVATAMLVELIRRLAEREPAIAGRGNFLIDALRGQALRWQAIVHREFEGG